MRVWDNQRAPLIGLKSVYLADFKPFYLVAHEKRAPGA
jgi:hypothetical protein